MGAALAAQRIWPSLSTTCGGRSFCISGCRPNRLVRLRLMKFASVRSAVRNSGNNMSTRQQRPACAGGFSRIGLPHVGFAEPIDQVVANRCGTGLDTLLLALGLPSRPGSMCASRARHRPQAARGFERLKTVSRPPVSFLPGAMQFAMMRAA